MKYPIKLHCIITDNKANKIDFQFYGPTNLSIYRNSECIVTVDHAHEIFVGNIKEFRRDITLNSNFHSRMNLE